MLRLQQLPRDNEAFFDFFVFLCVLKNPITNTVIAGIHSVIANNQHIFVDRAKRSEWHFFRHRQKRNRLNQQACILHD
jgi:hypothetical protein